MHHVNSLAIGEGTWFSAVTIDIFPNSNDWWCTSFVELESILCLIYVDIVWREVVGAVIVKANRGDNQRRKWDRVWGGLSLGEQSDDFSLWLTNASNQSIQLLGVAARFLRLVFLKSILFEMLKYAQLWRHKWFWGSYLYPKWHGEHVSTII